MRPLGRWWAAVPMHRWPEGDGYARIAEGWDDVWGDRRQELVFIGAGLNPAAITAALDRALFKGKAFTPEAWQALDDPFPAWGAA